MQGKLELFIDGGYYEKSKERWKLRSVDVGAFRNWCVNVADTDGLELHRTRYYDCLPFVDKNLDDRIDRDREVLSWQRGEEKARQRFFDAIERNNSNFEVKTGRLAPRSDSGGIKITHYTWGDLGTGRLGYIPCDHKGQKVYLAQKGVDTMMGTDIIDAAWGTQSLKHIVLVTGDSDFVPVMRLVQQRGFQVSLICAAENSRYLAHDDLVAAADAVHTFTRDDLKRWLINK